MAPGAAREAARAGMRAAQRSAATAAATSAARPPAWSTKTEGAVEGVAVAGVAASPVVRAASSAATTGAAESLIGACAGQGAAAAAVVAAGGATQWPMRAGGAGAAVLSPLVAPPAVNPAVPLAVPSPVPGAKAAARLARRSTSSAFNSTTYKHVRAKTLQGESNTTPRLAVHKHASFCAFRARVTTPSNCSPRRSPPHAAACRRGGARGRTPWLLSWPPRSRTWRPRGAPALGRRAAIRLAWCSVAASPTRPVLAATGRYCRPARCSRGGRGKASSPRGTCFRPPRSGRRGRRRSRDAPRPRGRAAGPPGPPACGCKTRAQKVKVEAWQRGATIESLWGGRLGI